MSAYDNDPRVDWVNEYFCVISTSEDRFDVAADQPQEFWISPSLSSPSMRAAGLKTRDEAEQWMQRVTRGPFPTADEAIRSLIGDPA
jgi:hypothetical protein